MQRILHWRWLLASALAPIGIALVRIAAQPMARTPIDRDLPLVALLIVGWSWAARESRWARAMEMAVPLLAIALLVLTDDDRLRLAAFGLIAATAFAMATVHARREAAERCTLVVSGLLLLRWLPLTSVEVLRESIVLAGTVLVFFVLAGFGDRDRPRADASFILIAALAVGLVAPIHPGRAMLFPFVLALLLFLVRSSPLALLFSIAAFVSAASGRSTKGPIFVAAGIAFLVLALVPRTRPRLQAPNASFPMRVLPAAIAFAFFAFWPWSGLIARALPLVSRYQVPGDRQFLGYALAASQVVTIDLPPRVRRVVVTASGANAARMRPGRLLGTIEGLTGASPVCRRSIVIGDVADFGFDRPSQFFSSRNSFPRFSEWDLRDYGMHTWIQGAGRVALDCGHDVSSLRITAAPGLAPDTRLQIESIEAPAR
ncbi:MAG: hypothetical protein ABIP63_10000 [Thermoanaerobaculia bacterium]